MNYFSLVRFEMIKIIFVTSMAPALFLAIATVPLISWNAKAKALSIHMNQREINLVILQTI